MSNLGQWTAGQLTVTADAINAILKANLEWQQNVFKIQKSQIDFSHTAAKDAAKDTLNTILAQANQTLYGSIGQILGGTAAIGLSGYGGATKTAKQNTEIAPMESKLTTCGELKTLCRETPAAGPGLGMQDEESPAVRNAKLLQEPDCHENPAVQAMTPEERAAAFAEMDAPAQQQFIENMHRSEYTLSDKVARVRQTYQNEIQQLNTVSQAGTTLLQGGGQALASVEKKDEAYAENAKVLANYISQTASVATQMLQSQASDAIGQKRAALDMEAQIASAQASANAA